MLSYFSVWKDLHVYLYECFVCTYMYLSSDFQLESQMVVNCHVGSGNWIHDLKRTRVFIQLISLTSLPQYMFFRFLASILVNTIIHMFEWAFLSRVYTCLRNWKPKWKNSQKVTIAFKKVILSQACLTGSTDTLYSFHVLIFCLITECCTWICCCR